MLVMALPVVKFHFDDSFLILKYATFCT
jgi:hypothetical protein